MGTEQKLLVTEDRDSYTPDTETGGGGGDDEDAGEDPEGAVAAEAYSTS